MKNILKPIICVMFLLTGCIGTENITPTAPVQTVIVIMPTSTAPATQITVNTPTPLSTQKPIETNSKDIKIVLSVDQVPPDPINIVIKQRLIVIPPPGWGEYGWDVTYDPSMLRLEPDIDPKIPSKGSWIWTAMKTGDSQIMIRSIPLPCESQPNPCVIPDFTSNLHVSITQG